MASLRDIRTRIGSVQNTQQITRAMKMVAAAKLRKAQERIFTTRPYAFKIREMIGHLRQRLDPLAHPLFEAREEVGGVLLIVVTSDRGLAGAFNSNLLKVVEARIAEAYADLPKENLHVLAVGRKGHEYFANRGYDLVGDFRGAFNDLRFPIAGEVMDIAIEGFQEGRWDLVEVVYNEFKNTISQNRVAEQLLPIPSETFFTPVMEDAEDVATETADADEVEYIFEPSAEVLLERLVPEDVQYQLWRAMLESNASEQGARMVAMENATTNAGELLKDLRLTYNRARQAAITTEIIEISSGAEALRQAQGG
ncbi:MAG TPA: ATP synthase F1 subunit gamma [Bacteroidetes bacterium]|nr:ATP synthase F1 subunit gamma [Bacteroidota bacterium]